MFDLTTYPKKQEIPQLKNVFSTLDTLCDASQQHSNCSAAHFKSKYLSKANSAKVWHFEKTGDKMTIIPCLHLARQKGAVLQSGLRRGGKCKLLRNRSALSDPPVLSKQTVATSIRYTRAPVQTFNNSFQVSHLYTPQVYFLSGSLLIEL